jgi:hypothetical protein
LIVEFQVLLRRPQAASVLRRYFVGPGGGRHLRRRVPFTHALPIRMPQNRSKNQQHAKGNGRNKAAATRLIITPVIVADIAQICE